MTGGYVVLTDIEDSEASATSPRLGRPLVLSPEERREALIGAGGRVFLRDGFAGATMEKIAAEAEMSKRTLYHFFADKRAVLEALLGAHDQRPPLLPYAHHPGDDPRDEMRRCLISLVEYLLDPMQIGLTRLVIAEAPQHPELTRLFEGLEISGVVAQVEERLRRLAADGAICLKNPEEMADLMIGSVINPWQLLALTSSEAKRVKRKEIEGRVERVLTIFAAPLGMP